MHNLRPYSSGEIERMREEREFSIACANAMVNVTAQPTQQPTVAPTDPRIPQLIALFNKMDERGKEATIRTAVIHADWAKK